MKNECDEYNWKSDHETQQNPDSAPTVLDVFIGGQAHQNREYGVVGDGGDGESREEGHVEVWKVIRKGG